MSFSGDLLQPGEVVAKMEQPPHGSQEWAYGYNWAPIENSTHAAGNSVILEVEPGGAVEPVLIVEDIKLTVRALQGRGWAIIYNVDNLSKVKAREVDPEAKPIELVKGDAYFYINKGDRPLILRDDATPAFQGHEEVQLTTTPGGEVDGRTIELPRLFWQMFVEAE